MHLLLDKLNRVIERDKAEARQRAHVAICESKNRFNTKQEAKRYADWIVSRGGDPRILPYRCPICNKFHLTRKKS